MRMRVRDLVTTSFNVCESRSMTLMRKGRNRWLEPSSNGSRKCGFQGCAQGYHRWNGMWGDALKMYTGCLDEGRRRRRCRVRCWGAGMRRGDTWFLQRVRPRQQKHQRLLLLLFSSRLDSCRGRARARRALVSPRSLREGRFEPGASRRGGGARRQNARRSPH